MDKMTQRAATIAANKILAANGYDPKGLSLQATARKQLAAKRARQGEARAAQKASTKARRQSKRAKK